MANIFNSSPNVLAILSCVDRGEYRRWKLVQGPVSASLRVLFLLQESAAARLLQIVWKGRPRFLSRLYLLLFSVSFSVQLRQQGGWCVVTALDQRDSGSHLIPFEVIFLMKTGPFKP